MLQTPFSVKVEVEVNRGCLNWPRQFVTHPGYREITIWLQPRRRDKRGITDDICIALELDLFLMCALSVLVLPSLGTGCNRPMAAKEVNELKAELAKASAKDPMDAERVTDLLDLLSKQEMSLAILKETKVRRKGRAPCKSRPADECIGLWLGFQVGKIVNALRKNSNADVSKKAADLTAAWKALLRKSMAANKAKSMGKANAGEAKKAADAQKPAEKKPSAEAGASDKSDSDALPAAYKLGETGSNMRDRIQTLILKVQARLRVLVIL